jgi:UDP-N-acetylmuramoylalanine--D-glutamate ligase
MSAEVPQLNCLVLGAGVSGRAAERLARKEGFNAVVLDGDDGLPEGDFAFAVASPGVPCDHRWIEGCRGRGIPVMSELQFGCEELLRQGWKLLAVTGSKGKSSVVKVTADAINLSGVRAAACGNYGYPVSDLASEGGYPGWAVVEVSSFMLELTRLPADAFKAAAVLNLQEDHLDRHGSVEEYHSLKLGLLKMAENGFVATEGPVPAGSYFDNEILRVNGAAAAALMRAAGVDEECISRAFLSFRPLDHRMQEIACIRGVRYIDDSKATSLAALRAAVVMAGDSVRLIAGGTPKGDDPSDVLPDLTKRVKKVYLIGRCAEEFFRAWHESVDCEICGDIGKAVEAAMREAVKGETVVLSPGAASYDQFKNFGERGEVFASLVKKKDKIK